jgi:hypothetical protein
VFVLRTNSFARTSFTKKYARDIVVTLSVILRMNSFARSSMGKRKPERGTAEA